jgi:predicted HAD superfamily Cof-like phosphohydrolase
MNRMQQDVAEFHHKFNHPIGDPASPSLPDLNGREFRAKLIMEEAEELRDAILANDLPEAIDGGCDLMYVVLGTFVAAGIDLQPFFDEVHRTNMLKVHNPAQKPDEPQKPLKPPGWSPPDMVKLLERYKERAIRYRVEEEVRLQELTNPTTPPGSVPDSLEPITGQRHTD